jgi:uncharacterized protein YbjT (DUF2867 family)
VRTALVIGATGLVGSHLVEKLCASDRYGKINILSRRPLRYENPKIEVRIIDFNRPDATQVTGDDVFCAIGTTIRKAGSKEKQYKVDCEYPAHLALIAKENGAQKFILVSSVGADAKSANFYLGTKGRLEEKLKALDYNKLVILRPSIILGRRREFRLGEKIGIAMVKLLRPLMIGSLKKYRGVEAAAIAGKMLEMAAQGTNEKIQIIASEQIKNREE